MGKQTGHGSEGTVRVTGTHPRHGRERPMFAVSPVRVVGLTIPEEKNWSKCRGHGELEERSERQNSVVDQRFVVIFGFDWGTLTVVGTR